MEQTKGACMVMVATFLALIAVEPLVQAVHDLHSGQPVAALEIFKRAPTPKHLRAYEDTLSEQSVIANAARPWMQFWRYFAMNDAGKNGLIGRGDWLFYRPGVQFLVEPWPTREETEDPIAAIVSFRDQLKTRGIELLILIAPGKESVYPMQLSIRADSLVNGHVTGFVDSLKRHGINTIYAGPTAAAQLNAPGAEPSGPAYLAQDTHWTPARAKSVAEFVAQYVLEKGWITRGTSKFDVKNISLDRYGDILRMAKSEPLLRSRPPEKIECEQVIERPTGKPYKDDANSPVLVLGDSFLRIFQSDEPTSAGFIAHFARALSMPVASIVNDGGASTLVRQELRRKPELLKGKKLVIWEFVERDIRFGTEGWKMVELP